MAELDCDVVIVGAGPVGLTIAIELASLGHKVQLLERHAALFPVPRAVCLFHQGARNYQALGLLEDLTASGAVASVTGWLNPLTRYVDHDGNDLTTLNMWSGTPRSGGPPAYCVHQPSMEADLEAACEKSQHVQFRRRIDVAGVQDLADHVQVHVRDLAHDGREEVIKAKFVIGCDGSKSTVRQCAGIDLHEHVPAMSRWLVIDVIPTVKDAAYGWDGYGYAKQHFDYERPRTTVPSPPERRRFEAMLLENESSEEAITDEFIFGKILPYWNCGPETAEIERRTVYSIAGAWAETFNKGRILLAGDSAHVAPQFLGQGLNSGLRDAKSLSWRINHALKFPNGNWDELFDQYTAEQLDTTRNFVALAKAVEGMLIVTDPEQAAKRDAMMKQGGPPPADLERVGPGMHLREEQSDCHPSATPGTLSVHDQVLYKGEKVMLDHMTGHGWVLISGPSVNIDQALSSNVKQSFDKVLAGRLAPFGGDGALGDVSGRFTEWFKETGAAAFLVRPDFYIYGIAKTAGDIDGLVESALSGFRNE